MTDERKPSDPSKPLVRQRVRPAANAAAAEPNPRTIPNREMREAAASMSPASEERVGYCNPPKSTRFKPGFDPRRPRGRKAGAKNKSNAIIAMMESPTAMRAPDGSVRTVATAEALARKLRELGLSGDRTAIIKAFELLLKALPPASPDTGNHSASPVQTLDEVSASDQAILAAFEEEIIARSSKGKKP